MKCQKTPHISRMLSDTTRDWRGEVCKIDLEGDLEVLGVFSVFERSETLKKCKANYEK